LLALEDVFLAAFFGELNPRIVAAEVVATFLPFLEAAFFLAGDFLEAAFFLTGDFLAVTFLEAAFLDVVFLVAATINENFW